MSAALKPNRAFNDWVRTAPLEAIEALLSDRYTRPDLLQELNAVLHNYPQDFGAPAQTKRDATQRMVDALIGLPKVALGCALKQWEQERNTRPSLADLSALANAYKRTMQYILCNRPEPDPEPPAPPPERLTHQRALEILADAGLQGYRFNQHSLEPHSARHAARSPQEPEG